MVGFLAPLYTLTVNELRRRGTKAALKEIAKRLKSREYDLVRTIKKEGLKTTKYKIPAKVTKKIPGANLSGFAKRTNPFAAPKIDLTKLKTAHPINNKGIAAGATLGAAGGYVAGSDAEKKKKKKKTKPSMTWNK
tara:strand:+ start:142 stop:546 length:405 start_codon:yes stop_codon:yes gene_type:complete